LFIASSFSSSTLFKLPKQF